jgi:phage terminase large subunit-like protein
MEAMLVHGPGDIVGKPYRLTPANRRFIWECYELNPGGSRIVKRAIKGEPKGKAKTELVAAIALAELAGPVRFDGWDDHGNPRAREQVSPDIPIAAASFEQADELFTCATTMVKEGPLDAFLNTFDTEILFKDGRPGQLYRVAAAAGTNDGKKPTFVGLDELHEFLGTKERVHTVLSNGVAKRADAWECIISTAGYDPGVEMGEPITLMGRLYLHGKAVLAGEIDDPGLLFRWLEFEGDVDLTDSKSIEVALLQLYPDGERFQPISGLVAKVRELVVLGKSHEAMRYFFNRFTNAETTWLPEGAWSTGDIGAFEFDPAEPMYVGVDSASKHDSHANVFAQWNGDKLRVKAQIWERPKDENGRPIEGWKLPIAEVENDLREAHREFNLDSVNYDPALFERSAQQLELEGLPMVEVPQSNARMVPATQATYELIVQDRLGHDGDPTFARHIASAVAVEVPNGGYRLKKAKSRAKMDAAIALCLAVDAAVRQEGQGVSVYEERGILTV